MTVYVDDMRAEYRQMVMCHMIADTEDELHDMAKKIGVRRRWFQRDHYDISTNKKARAVIYGAKQISWRDCCLMMIRRHREGWDAPLLTVQEGYEYMQNKGKGNAGG